MSDRYAPRRHRTFFTDLTKSRCFHGELRQCLIDATINLMSEEGINNLLLRQVAKRVGVSYNSPKSFIIFSATPLAEAGRSPLRITNYFNRVVGK
ncbi:MAG: hypothetical protein RMX97_11790 [Nostoc sp. DedQUE11]|nr:hypothetical protein [Nostoc sp. DedQUE11]